MTDDAIEDPTTGYFNVWTGRHPFSAVHTIDLHNHATFPPLDRFPMLRNLWVPRSLLDENVLDQLRANTQIESLRVGLCKGEPPPRGIYHLTHLVELDLYGNQLTELPDVFDQLPNLTDLNIAHNRITSIPPTVLRSMSLRGLNLSSNELSSVPDFSATPLEQLDIDYNPIADFEAEHLPWRIIYLSAACPTARMSPAIANRLSLCELKIAVRDGSPLPDLSRLSLLTDLRLAGAHLGEAVLEQLPAGLEVLEGIGSRRFGLQRVPPSLARFRRLRKLNVNFEHVTELAPELLDMPLHELRASSTKLGDTPTYAYLPSTLRVLHLANVGMTRLPDRIRELTLDRLVLR